MVDCGRLLASGPLDMGPCHSGKAVLNPAYEPVFPAPEVGMSALKKDPLRPLRPEERSHLERLSRALGLPAALVARAKVLLAVANGYSYTAAAQLAGRRTGDAVAALVSLFNRQGLTALEPRHAGGPAVLYDAAAKERILAEFH